MWTSFIERGSDSQGLTEHNHIHMRLTTTYGCMDSSRSSEILYVSMNSSKACVYINPRNADVVQSLIE